MDYNVFLLNIQDKINQEDFFNLKLKFEQLQNKKRSFIKFGIFKTSRSYKTSNYEYDMWFFKFRLVGNR